MNGKGSRQRPHNKKAYDKGWDRAFKKKIPNPGSSQALAMGCLCPQMDNKYGVGSGWGKGAFWINMDCPLHGTSHRLSVKQFTNKYNTRGFYRFRKD